MSDLSFLSVYVLLMYVDGAMWQVELPRGSVVKNSLANEGDSGDPALIPEQGRSLGGGNGNLLQYSCLENSMDRGAWQATAHGVAKSLNTTEQLSAHVHMWLVLANEFRLEMTSVLLLKKYNKVCLCMCTCMLGKGE